MGLKCWRSKMTPCLANWRPLTPCTMIYDGSFSNTCLFLFTYRIPAI